MMVFWWLMEADIRNCSETGMHNECWELRKTNDEAFKIENGCYI